MIAFAALAAAAALARTDAPPAERFTDADLRALADQLMDAEPGLARAREAVRAVRADGAPAEVDVRRSTVRRGSYDRATGTLVIGTARADGSPLPDELVRATLVHELAHAAMPTGAHSAEWSDLFARSLGTATERLGWRVLLECSACRAYGLCDEQAHCPLCRRKACADARAVTGSR
jgi:hypothetical protein